MNRVGVACLLLLCVLCVDVSASRRVIRRGRVGAYPSISYLPDPFAFQNGTRITSLAEWPALAAEQSELVQKLELGVKPAVPDVKGVLNGKVLSVTVTYQSKSITFNSTIAYPTSGTAPYPAVIGIGGVSLSSTLLSGLGVATISFPNDQVAQQQDGTSRGKGLFYTLYGADHSAGAMIAWAWGVDCLVTALEQTADANKIDTKHLATNGCSRNGKGAMIAAVFVDRIVLGIPQESGSGGADTWRVSDWMMDVQGIKTQTLAEIVQEDVWFSTALEAFVNLTNTLPFDHHTISSLMGPKRAILFVENTGIDWLGGYSGWVQANAAQKVFEAFGVPDSIGFTGVSHQDHCAFQDAQAPAVTAFVQKFLLGQTGVSTKFMSTQSNVSIDPAWIPWKAPFETKIESASERLTTGQMDDAVSAAPLSARVVDEGSDRSLLSFSVHAEGRTAQAVRVFSGSRHVLTLNNNGADAIFAARGHVATPFTLEIQMADGAMCRARVAGLASGRVFKCK